MAQNNNETSVVISADVAKLMDGMAKSQASVAQTVAQMNQKMTELSSAGREAANSFTLSAEKIGGAGKIMEKGFNGLSSTATQMQGAFSGIKAGIAGLTVVIGGMVAAMAFDKVNKFVSEFQQVGRETKSLQNALGTSSQEASAWRDAVEDAGLSTEEFSHSIKKMVLNVSNNEAAFKSLGMTTRDSNGNLLQGKALYEEATKTLAQYKSGTDRMAAAMFIFGKSAEEAEKYLKVNGDAVEESRKKLEKLGLLMTAQEQGDLKRYKEANKDVGDVMEAVAKKIATAAIPILTQHKEKFVEYGQKIVEMAEKAGKFLAGVMDVVMSFVEAVSDMAIALYEFHKGVVEIFASVFDSVVEMVTGTKSEAIDWESAWKATVYAIKASLNGLVATFELLLAVVTTSIEIFRAVFEAIGVVVGTWANAIVSVMTKVFDAISGKGKWSGVLDEWQKGLNDIAVAAEKSGERIVRAYDGMAEKAAKIIKNMENKNEEALNGKPVEQKEKKEDKGKKGFTKPKTGAENDDVTKANLAVKKAELEAELGMLRQSLSEQQSELDRGLARHLVTFKDYYAEKAEIARQSLVGEAKLKQQELANVNQSIGEAKTEKERLGFKAQAIKLQGEINVLKAKELEIDRDATFQAEQKDKELNKQLLTLKETLAKLMNTGDVSARLANIKAKYADLPKEILDAVGPDGKKIVDKLINVEQAQANIDAIETKLKNMKGKDARDEVGLKDQLARGLITEYNYKAAIMDLEGRSADKKIAALQAEIEAYRKMGGVHDEEIAKIETEIAAQQRLKEKVTETAKEMNENLQKSFEDMLSGFMTGTKKAKDVFKDFVNSITSMISKVASKYLSEQLMGAINGTGSKAQDPLNGIFGKLFGGGKSNASNDANNALATAANAAKTSLEGMAKNGADTATKSLIETSSKTLLEGSVTETLTSSLASLTAAATSAAAALSSVGASNATGQESGGSSGGGGLFGMFGNLFGGLAGARATGGLMMPGEPYLVGENGPEIVVPPSSGRVLDADTTSGMLRGGGQTINMNISTPDANSFRKSQNQILNGYGSSMRRAQARNG